MIAYREPPPDLECRLSDAEEEIGMLTGTVARLDAKIDRLESVSRRNDGRASTVGLLLSVAILGFGVAMWLGPSARDPAAGVPPGSVLRANAANSWRLPDGGLVPADCPGGAP